jgi:hypothetical protein
VIDTRLSEEPDEDPSAVVEPIVAALPGAGVRSFSAEYWLVTAGVAAFVGLALFYKREWWGGFFCLTFSASSTVLAVRAHRRGY